jgi:putative DNA primase/helicase
MSLQAYSDEMCPTTSVVAFGRRYSAAEIEAALPKAQPKAQPKATVKQYDAVPLPPDQSYLVDSTASSMATAQPALWSGNWDAIKGVRKQQIYPSQSEADMALASHIARRLVASNVPEALLGTLTDAVFSRSGLAQRDKWQSRADYRAGTIGRACASALPGCNKPSAPSAAVDWSQHGDVRNAHYFANRWRNELAYVPERKRWMRWEGGRWAWCMAGEDVEYAKETCRALYQAAGEELARDPEKGQKLVRDAVVAHSVQRLKAMLELAQSDPALVVSASRLDAKSCFLGVSNGVVDLSSTTLLPNRPALYITRHCIANYHPDAPCPRWFKFLDEVFEGDQATINSVQRLLGYALTGLNTEEILTFCVGFGANGKSIFGNVISDIFGDYAKAAPSTMLAARRADDHGPRGDIAMLDGVRLVSINELPAGMHLDEQVVKQLAGREPISARYLYGEFFTYQPRFSAWVRTNHKPIIKGDDDGIWRRIVIIPFRRKFSQAEQDTHLEAKLLSERDGILRWMVEGAQAYLTQGLYLSPAMRAERMQYRKESDLLGEFLEERTTRGQGQREEQSALYNGWDFWCRQNGTQPGTKATFTRRLAERGIAAAQSNSKRFYVGLSINRGAVDATGQEGRV